MPCTSPTSSPPARRDRIQEAGRPLGYRPNQAARQLLTGRTGNLGIVVPDLQHPFFAGVVKGVQARARTLGFALFVADADEHGRLAVELVVRESTGPAPR